MKEKVQLWGKGVRFSGLQVLSTVDVAPENNAM